MSKPCPKCDGLIDTLLEMASLVDFAWEKETKMVTELNYLRAQAAALKLISAERRVERDEAQERYLEAKREWDSARERENATFEEVKYLRAKIQAVQEINAQFKLEKDELRAEVKELREAAKLAKDALMFCCGGISPAVENLIDESLCALEKAGVR